MRFKTSLKNIKTFTKFAASLASLGKVAWVRLDDDHVRFTVMPEHGSQVWAQIPIDALFEDYNVQSRSDNNMINLELPLPPLQSALKSATNATSANLRLTKRNGDAILTLTATTISAGSGVPANGFLASGGGNDLLGDDEFREESLEGRNTIGRETLVTQEIPIRVLSVESVKDLHEPVLREPDVNILLPSLLQLKAISDRFTKLALSTTSRGAYSSAASGPKLELSANMFGSLKISLTTDSLNINSVWTDLLNPEVQDKTDEEKAELPSTKMRDAGKEAWATVRIDGKDWGRVLSVGRLGGRVVASFVHDHALVLYVYIDGDEDGAEQMVLTYYVSSITI